MGDGWQRCVCGWQIPPPASCAGTLSLWISIHRCKHYITDVTSAKTDVPQAAQENWRLENQPPLHLWVKNHLRGGSGVLGASPSSREELEPGTWLWRAEQTGWMPHLTLCYPSLWKLQIQLPENETEAQTSRFQSNGVKQKSNRRIKGLNVPPGPP